MSFHQKTFRVCDRSQHSYHDFFEKFRKKRGGHRALGRLKRCRKHVNTAKDKFGTQRHVNKAHNIYLLMYEF
jgi:hypothetical protein